MKTALITLRAFHWALIVFFTAMAVSLVWMTFDMRCPPSYFRIAVGVPVVVEHFARPIAL